MNRSDPGGPSRGLGSGIDQGGTGSSPDYPHPASQKRGGSIVVAGPDGTGKSTLARNLLAGPLANERVVHIYGRPKILPRPGRDQAPSAAENRRQPPLPVWLSLLRTVYVFVDFVLGWIVHVRPVVRAGGWVIIERGWWDLVVDPGRFRLQGSAGLARRLAVLGPSPDLVLILEATADVVRSRKDRLSEAEVMHQARLWHTVLPTRVRRAYLDANQPAEVVLQLAEAELLRLREPGRRSLPTWTTPRPTEPAAVRTSRAP